MCLPAPEFSIIASISPISILLSVRRSLIAASVIMLVVWTVTACGSQNDEPGVAPGAKTAATISTTAAIQPIIRDIAVLRKAANAGQSDEAVDALYDLLDAAQSRPDDREGWKGAVLIRTRLPRIVNRFLADYPRTRRRLRAYSGRGSQSAARQVISAQARWSIAR